MRLRENSPMVSSDTSFDIADSVSKKPCRLCALAETLFKQIHFHDTIPFLSAPAKLAFR